jgi:hypothetical protein
VSIVAPNAKAIASGVGNAILVAGFVTTMVTEVAPQNATLAGILSVASAVIAGANTFHVWLVKNEDTVQAALDAGAELVGDLEHGKHALGSTAPQSPQ